MKRSKSLSVIATGILACGTLSTINIDSARAASMYQNVDVTIDFDEQVGVGSNPLTGGPKLDKLWAGYGLEMDSSKKELWLYDSNCKPTAGGVSKNGFTNVCTGGDEDLATGKGKYKKNGKWIKYKTPEQGKVLIIQENNGSPDDLAGGGIISFDFTDKKGVLFDHIGLLDFDDPGVPEFSFTFLDGTTETLQFDTEADNNDPNVTLLSKKWNNKSLTGDNSLRDYKFDFSKRVQKLDISLPGSGAISYLKYQREEKRKIPESTSAFGLLFGTIGTASVLKRKRKTAIL